MQIGSPAVAGLGNISTWQLQTRGCTPRTCAYDEQQTAPDRTTNLSAAQNGGPRAACRPPGLAGGGSVPQEKHISKKFLSGLLESSSESFARTLIAVLKKPGKECNNLFFSGKMGGSPPRAASLRLKTCRTSGLAPRFALMVVHGTRGGHISRQKAGKMGSLFLPPLVPSMAAQLWSHGAAHAFQALTPQGKALSMVQPHRKQRKAWDNCPKLHHTERTPLSSNPNCCRSVML